MSRRRLIDGSMPDNTPGKHTGRVGRPSKLDKTAKKKIKGNKRQNYKQVLPSTKPEFDQEFIDKICNAIRGGTYVETAAALYGVTKHQLRYWVVRGTEEPDTLYGALVVSIHKAIAEWEVRATLSLNQMGLGAPAEYLMQPARNSKNEVIMDSKGNPVMEPARDIEGNIIQKKKELLADPKVLQWLMERRQAGRWGKTLLLTGITPDDILKVEPKLKDVTPEGEDPSKKNAVTDEQYNAMLKELKFMIKQEEELGGDEPD